VRRRLTIVLLGIIAIIAVPALSGAAIVPGDTTTPSGFLRFCANAQTTIANVDNARLTTNGGDFTIFNTVYKSLDDFVYSKSSVSTSTKRVNTSQWTLYTDLEQTQPKLLRCKLRTGESFTAGNWPAGSSNNSGRFVVEPVFGFASAGIGLSTIPSTDQTCRVINQQTIDNVWASLSTSNKNAAVYNPTGSNLLGANANTLVTVPDTVVSDGPSWTPEVAAVSTSGSVAQVGSRALVATSNSTGNARFEGAHYCTLVAPEFLKRVLLGQVSPS